ncbi:hypothetical protein J7E24_05245 [Hymenobacter sp. ISL-91]|uniref:hypothetical protein n=1 Tax=Hymenobacter sp. ISL-91 TaxID=2819151 RepID=UPI001BE587CB|nr:hypothetical protein [Hymenobacter sp. ISL-91]MBT2557180.1 hypothetical protein [Hymenobacter sp. ISL-91]
MLFSVYPRVLALFYRSVLPLTGLLSAIIAGADGVSAGLLGTPWPPPLSAGLVLLKLSTFPLAAYLLGRMRPYQYGFYRNLHLAPWQLWAFVAVLDTGLFGGLIVLLHLLFA